MDREFTPSSKRAVHESISQTSIDKIEDFLKNNKYIVNLEILLPYVIYVNDTVNFNYKFGNIITDKIDYEKCINIYYMKLIISDDFNKRNYRLSLSAEAEVIPQLFTRNFKYYYVWNKNHLKIEICLNDLNINKIEQYSIELLNEFKRFYFMYCK